MDYFRLIKPRPVFSPIRYVRGIHLTDIFLACSGHFILGRKMWYTVHMFKEYRDYLRNNPEGYWFKRKLYGWGWTPARWQGWVTVVIFIGLIAANGMRVDSDSYSVSDTLLNFIPETFILVAILIFICWLTGEKPRWQWGIPKKDNLSK